MSSHLLKSECVVLLQTASVLLHPWYLVELYTALENAVPIVPVDLVGRGYDFAGKSSACGPSLCRWKSATQKLFQAVCDEGIDVDVLGQAKIIYCMYSTDEASKCAAR